MERFMLCVRSFHFVQSTKNLTRRRNRLLLPLNVCRKDKMYLPWECDHERHVYEKCVVFDCVFVLLDADKDGWL